MTISCFKSDFLAPSIIIIFIFLFNFKTFFKLYKELYLNGNSVLIKIYRASEETEYIATATYSAGTGTFGDLFMAVSELTLDLMLDNDDVWFGPSSYTLSQNYPNPFNPATEISFDAGINGNVSKKKK